MTACSFFPSLADTTVLNLQYNRNAFFIEFTRVTSYSVIHIYCAVIDCTWMLIFVALAIMSVG